MGDSRKGGSDTKVSTSTELTNAQTGASEGALAFGQNSQGNTVNVSSSDAAVVGKVSDALIQLNADSNQTVGGVARYSIAAQNSSEKNALDFADKIGNNAIDQNSNIALQTVKGAQSTAEEANAILSRSFETYAGALKDNTGVAPSTVFTGSLQTLAYAAAVVLVAYFLFKKPA